MKKIIQRTKGFEKSFSKLPGKIQRKFIDRLEIFVNDQNAAALKIHPLRGDMKDCYAFSVTGDVRAIFRKQILDNRTVFVFTFVDIGGHSAVY